MNEIIDIKKETLILGKGFLGSEFIRRGFENFTTRNDFDATSDNCIYKLDEIINKKYTQSHIKYIINCIGIANTRYCEDDKNFNEILKVNGYFPGQLSNYCDEHNIKLVHISTGCLYDRRSGLNKEDDFISAHCNYVVTKWVGEKGININNHLIIRPRLYFSDIDNSLNLISKFKNFKFILNELNSVTSTRTIVEAIEALLLSNQVGIFNVANDGAYTIKQLSEAIGYKWSDEQVVDQHDLHKSQKLYLVNNVLDLSKLKQFYQPRDAIQEIKDLSNNLI